MSVLLLFFNLTVADSISIHSFIDEIAPVLMR